MCIRLCVLRVYIGYEELTQRELAKAVMESWGVEESSPRD